METPVSPLDLGSADLRTSLDPGLNPDRVAAIVTITDSPEPKSVMVTSTVNRVADPLELVDTNEWLAK